MGVWRLSRAFKSVPLAWITFFSIHGKVGNQTAGGVQKKQVCPSFHLFRRHIFSNIFFSPKVYSNDKVNILVIYVNSNVVTVVVVAVLSSCGRWGMMVLV